MALRKAKYEIRVEKYLKSEVVSTVKKKKARIGEEAIFVCFLLASMLNFYFSLHAIS